MIGKDPEGMRFIIGERFCVLCPWLKQIACLARFWNKSGNERRFTSRHGYISYVITRLSIQLSIRATYPTNWATYWKEILACSFFFIFSYGRKIKWDSNYKILPFVESSHNECEKRIYNHIATILLTSLSLSLSFTFSLFLSIKLND